MTMPRGFAVPLSLTFEHEVSSVKFLDHCLSKLRPPTEEKSGGFPRDVRERLLASLKKHWVRTCGDLRLLITDGHLRSIGLPLRLCVLMERELAKVTASRDSGGGALVASPLGVSISPSYLDPKVRPSEQERKVGIMRSRFRRFDYKHDLDENGVLYFLGTHGLRRSYQNPALQSLVNVTCTGVLPDSVPISAVCGRSKVRCVTNAMHNAWVQIDFLNTWIAPTFYTLRHYSSWDTECLRHWRLEGTADGVTWHLLREHRNDESLDKEGKTVTWPLTGKGNRNHDLASLSRSRNPYRSSGSDTKAQVVEGVTLGTFEAIPDDQLRPSPNPLPPHGMGKDVTPPMGFFRAFRVVMTGPNSNTHLYLACSGFEIYGVAWKPSHTAWLNIAQLATPVPSTPSSVMSPHSPSSPSTSAESLGESPVSSRDSLTPNKNLVSPTPSKKDLGVLGRQLRESHASATVFCPVPAEGAGVGFRRDDVLHVLGSDGFARDWRNPALGPSAVVLATASSTMQDSEPAAAVCGQAVVRFVTCPERHSWLRLDLRDYRVALYGYGLRHYSTWSSEALRNWTIEVSADDEVYHVLRSHTEDATLQTRGGTGVWTVDDYYLNEQGRDSSAQHKMMLGRSASDYRRPVRYVRIYQTGANSNKHFFLALSGIALYGALYKGDKPITGGYRKRVRAVLQEGRAHDSVRQIAGGTPALERKSSAVDSKGDFSLQSCALPVVSDTTLVVNLTGRVAVKTMRDLKIPVRSFAPGREPFSDGHGLFNFLGTMGGSQRWSNPATPDGGHTASVIASSLGESSWPAHSVIGREAVRCVSKPLVGSYFSVRLACQVACAPLAYTLRHYVTWNSEALRHWRLDGSMDGEHWYVLREHRDDASLQGKGQAYCWMLKPRFLDTRTGAVVAVDEVPWPSRGRGALNSAGPKTRAQLSIAESDPPNTKDDLATRWADHTRRVKELLSWVARHRPHWRVQPWSIFRVYQTGRNSSNHHYLALSGWELYGDALFCGQTGGVTQSSRLSSAAVRLARLSGPWGGGIRSVPVSSAVTARRYASETAPLPSQSVRSPGVDEVGVLQTERKGQDDENNHEEVVGDVKAVESSERKSGDSLLSPWARNTQGVLLLRRMTWDPHQHGKQIVVLGGDRQPLSDKAISDAVGLTRLASGFLVRNRGSKDKWQIARSLEGLCAGERYRVALRLVEDPKSTNHWKAIVGLVSDAVDCCGQKQWVGTNRSWGYIAGTGGKCHIRPASTEYGDTWARGDLLELDIDLVEGTLQFLKNGVAQGEAFNGLLDGIAEESGGTGKPDDPPVIRRGSSKKITLHVGHRYHVACSLTGTGATMMFVNPDPVLTAGHDRIWDERYCSLDMRVDGQDASLVVNRGVKHKWQSVRGARLLAPRGSRSPDQKAIDPEAKDISRFTVELVETKRTENSWQVIVGCVPANFVCMGSKQWVGALGGYGYIGGTGGICHDRPESTDYGVKFGRQHDRITCEIDWTRETLSYSVNGKDMGVAFRGVKTPLYPAVSLTAQGSIAKLIIEE